MSSTVYGVLTAVLVVLSLTSYIPQLIRIIKTKSTKDLSLVSWLLYDLYFALYMTLLVIDNASIRVIIVTTVDCMLCIIITLLILKYKNKQ